MVFNRNIIIGIIFIITSHYVVCGCKTDYLFVKSKNDNLFMLIRQMTIWKELLIKKIDIIVFKCINYIRNICIYFSLSCMINAKRWTIKWVIFKKARTENNNKKQIWISLKPISCLHVYMFLFVLSTFSQHKLCKTIWRKRVCEANAHKPI